MAYQQLVIVGLRINGEVVVFGVPMFVFVVAKFDPQYILLRSCHAVDVLVAKPELGINIAEAILVLFPLAIEVNRTVLPTLENLQWI